MIKNFLIFPIAIIGFWVTIFDFFYSKKAESSHITLCVSNENSKVPMVQLTEFNTHATFKNLFGNDSTISYSMPLLANTYNGKVMMSWTEKEKDITSFCMAVSADGGKTFENKKVIFSGAGVSSSRMMRAKVLSKKDGSFMAVFSNREVPAGAPQGGRGGGRSSNIVYCVSRDNGNNWTAPISVDSDPKQGIVRGFFDAVVLPNDEVAVAYLKDVANSTKHEERDLRMVITKNGAFLPEKVIDPVVCDCCPINMIIDAEGALNVVYRDNNDDIRDFAKMVSTDNGQTFTKPVILNNDGWKIQGCPHSGAVSSGYDKKSALFAYYSGAETEKGIRLVTKEGKKLLVLTDNSARNAALAQSNYESVLLWEQINGNSPQLAYKKVKNDQVSETFWLKDTAGGVNATTLSTHNQVMVAYEVKNKTNNNSIKISYIQL